VWTRDGKSIVYSSDAYGGSMVNLYTIAAGAAAGSERRLLEDAELGQFPQSASACGDLAYIDGTRPLPINTSIWLWRRSGKPAVVVDGPGWKLHPAISPDCNWIAYDSDITGMKEIYLKPISQPGDAIRVSNGGGNSPIWGSSMNELFYRSGDAMNRVGLRYAGNTITPGRPEKLFEGSYAPPETWSNHILRGPDGRFLMSKIHNERDTLKKIHIILNGVR
jgi:hypothetical protein